MEKESCTYYYCTNYVVLKFSLVHIIHNTILNIKTSKYSSGRKRRKSRCNHDYYYSEVYIKFSKQKTNMINIMLLVNHILVRYFEILTLNLCIALLNRK